MKRIVASLLLVGVVPLILAGPQPASAPNEGHFWEGLPEAV